MSDIENNFVGKGFKDKAHESDKRNERIKFVKGFSEKVKKEIIQETSENTTTKLVETEENICWRNIQQATRPENILKTCYDMLYKFNKYEKELLELKTILELKNKGIRETTDKILADNELMAEWKEKYNITNYPGRRIHINEKFSKEREEIEKLKKRIKNIENGLIQDKRLFNLHLEVLKKSNDVKLPYQI